MKEGMKGLGSQRLRRWSAPRRGRQPSTACTASRCTRCGDGTAVDRAPEAPRRRHLLLAGVEEARLGRGDDRGRLSARDGGGRAACAPVVHRWADRDVLRLRGRPPTHAHPPAAERLRAVGPPQPPAPPLRRTDAELRRDQPGVGPAARHLRRARRGHGSAPHGPGVAARRPRRGPSGVRRGLHRQGRARVDADQVGRDRSDAFANVAPDA